MPSSPHRTIARIAVALTAGLLLALPVTAGAATSKYPSASDARGFVGGAAGWTSSSSTEGTCLAPVLCASVENTFQPSGGSDESGFIRSAYTGVAGATAVGGTTRGIWESPSFTYDGVDGDEATSIGFALDRRSNVDQLLAA